MPKNVGFKKILYFTMTVTQQILHVSYARGACTIPTNNETAPQSKSKSLG